MNKTFSIIMPTYNCEGLLKQSLDSIMKQDKQMFECVIVDGDSNDNTMGIILEYKKKFPNKIKYISEPDKGIYDAMNKGIDLAEGEYLYFIGAGDLLLPNTLSKIYKYADSNIDVIYGNVFIANRNLWQGYEVSKKDISINFMCHQQIFYRKRVFDELGKYSLEYKIYADAEFNIRCFGQDKYNIKYVNEDIARYAGDGFSENSKDENFIKDYKNIVYKYLGKEIYHEYYKHSGRELIDYLNHTEVKFEICGEQKNINSIIEKLSKDGFRDRIGNVNLKAKYSNIAKKSKEQLKIAYEYDTTVIEDAIVTVADFVKSAELMDFLKDAKEERIIIFGTSNLCRQLIKYIQYFSNHKHIYCLLDNNKDKANGELEGYKIYLPDKKLALKNYKILVASMWFKDIRDQLFELGCKKDNIIRVSS